MCVFLSCRRLARPKFGPTPSLPNFSEIGEGACNPCCEAGWEGLFDATRLCERSAQLGNRFAVPNGQAGIDPVRARRIGFQQAQTMGYRRKGQETGK